MFHLTSVNKVNANLTMMYIWTRSLLFRIPIKSQYVWFQAIET